MLNLPAQLAASQMVDQKVAVRVMLDLTLYLTGPSLDEFDELWDFYEKFCPPGRFVYFKIDELQLWSPVARPDLTESARSAAALGRRRPYLEATRRRVALQRSFTSRAWDGRDIADPQESWSFMCAGVRRREMGLRALARFLVPLSTEPDLIEQIAVAAANKFDVYSGHGGLVFSYDPFVRGSAFDLIYGLSKRFWGVDIEDIDRTLPLVSKRIKGVNWITVLGNELAIKAAGLVEELIAKPSVKIHKAAKGLVIVGGTTPAAGDRNRVPASPVEYRLVAEALAPLFLTSHPDFAGPRFIDGGDTLGWVRRFIEPGGW